MYLLCVLKKLKLIGKQGKYVDSQTEGQNIQNGINKKSANYQAARIMHEMNEAKWRAVHAKNNSGYDDPYKYANQPGQHGFWNSMYNGGMVMLHGFKGFF